MQQKDIFTNAITLIINSVPNSTWPMDNVELMLAV